MRVVINQDENNNEVEIVINCKVIDDNIVKIIEKLREEENIITGVKDSKVHIIKPENVLYFESVDKRTFIYTKKEVYESNLRLYEIEDKFSAYHFFRASKSTIINISKISVINTVIGGRVEVLLENKEKLIVSRQYVPILKAKLDY
ncbi:LytTR family DNA-binding domain-containing protein [Clostridium tertium]|jgi:DNA-binding LytR/AlgR family response regulator|uniref:LytTR family transcriptional regulator DNA-binding domain-containing protein n=2 Tax=Clostridium tertium TaxID=1559 RepID=A0A9X3XMI9_9CLOT|nr:LytTR family DNA-binding domain-containing protein [Clostridium tertium]MBU6136016.1 LytTR family transcriptional regulator DNA-binding domain-containing protein [Clostridium tertium]MDB1933589.1 LytTR family DNA-binding domain-containing protein [Clostridium tertium]MDB1936202.1 LytTR family DNA-binding domain-containing protein [Clostridium tertium]MDB1941258.1 LytTR family DNA-binding domain-containing protein [Clostridium tertium]MDB1970460.1 LytTR family DNA-binding domain-containing p